MPKIIKLPDALINKIAAGEVVERPAYIIKELVDNSLDAGAKSITVKVEGCGLDSIEVTDDGVGMAQDDLEMSYLRHTTSKVQEQDDLHAICSFGFRGEALASIAAVGSLTIASRAKESPAGKQITVLGGAVEEVKTVPMPQGTRVSVAQIFASVPARHKFLKSAKTEYRHILSILQSYAMALPEVRFELYHNGKRVFLYPTADTFSRRIESIIPESTFSNLLALTHNHEYIQVKGYISKPQLSYRSKTHHYFFINNRAVQDETVSAAIKEAYGTLLSSTDYPYVILYFEIPHHLVDVNVHPRKEQIQFADTQMVYDVVYEAVSQVLSSQDLRYYDKRWQRGKNEQENWILRDGGTNTYAAKKLKKQLSDAADRDLKTDTILQIHNLYIIVPTKDGLVMIDQHAAHERVLYERFEEAYKEGLAASHVHRLSKPFPIPLSPEEQALIDEYSEQIEEFGFRFTLDAEEITVIAVPKLLQDRDIEKLLRELLEHLAQFGEIKTIDSFAQKMLAYLACRSAIKAGDRLTKKRMRKLISELKEVQNPYTCPHGRPLQVTMELDSFHKMFKRK